MMSPRFCPQARPFALLRRYGRYFVRLTNGARVLGERELPTYEQAVSLVAYLAGCDRAGTLTVDCLAFNGDLFTGGKL